MNWNWNNDIKKVIDNEKLKYIKSLCDKWELNKLKNPITNFKIQENKGTYNLIKKTCNSKHIKNLDKSTNSKSSNKNNESNNILKKTSYDIDTNEYFPNIDDPEFIKKLNNLQEITVHTTSKLNSLNTLEDFENQVLKECPDNEFFKSYFQYFIQQYMSNRTLYKNLLLFYSVGVGKTCSAVSIAEGFLSEYSSFEEPLIWVILPKSLKTNFINTIYDFTLYGKTQCTNDIYLKLGKIDKNQPLTSEIKNKILKIIKQRYKILTYGEFNKEVSGNYILNNKIIIVDEAHNLRNKLVNEKEEDDDDLNEDYAIKTYNELEKVIENGNNNRLILMSGTPMYNKPDEIIELLNLFLLNDKKERINIKTIFDKNDNLRLNIKKKIIELSKKYISYINNKNPFSYSIRLSPENAIKNKDNIPSNIQNKKDYEWINYIKDGILLIKLGKEQEKYYRTNYKKSLHLSGFEPMNIVYKNNIGQVGFNSIFKKVDKKEKGSLCIEYRDKNEEILAEPLLSKYGKKISILLENIKESNGTVLVYSRFLWAGIIPCAIALEHIGYSRYGVKNNILNSNKSEDKNLTYAILTTPVLNLMGSESTSFDKLIEEINKDKVKVVFITQKASEGISFKNIREIHILEPWYHINRSEQIIGRGIRKCSHIGLSLEYRNTTIYQYCGYIDDIETKDVNTLKIAGNKIKNVDIITNIIKNNSIDCGIHKYINYYPPDIFKFGKLSIINSKNKQIEYNIKEEKEPECNINDGEDYRGVIKSNMKLSENLKNRIISYINKNRKEFYSFDEIFNNIKTYDGDNLYLYYAINQCLYPNNVINGYYLYLNGNGIQIIKKNYKFEYSTILINKKKDERVKIEPNIETFLNTIIKIENDKFKRLYKLYSFFNSLNFDKIIKSIIINNDKYKLIYNDLYNEGLIIKDGYINIFNNNEGIDINGDDIPIDEVEKIVKKYKVMNIDKKEKHTKMVIEFDKKKNYKKIDYKLYLKVNSKGASCFTKTKKVLNDEFNGINENKNISDICYDIIEKMYKNNKFFFIPEKKPIEKMT
jgi:hypothetical protein